VGSTAPTVLIAASGTGGHLFPALAVAEQLSDRRILWLGVPDRLEGQLVSNRYPLYTIAVGGFQKRLGFGSLKTLLGLLRSIVRVRQLLKMEHVQVVFTTGGYIAGPAILAARSLGIPVLLHESNALPGKVTRFLGPWCDQVLIGFSAAAQFLRRCRTQTVGTPIRAEFRQSHPLDLPIPEGSPMIVVIGGSQGAVAVNQLVRAAAPRWLETGYWIVHLTGNNDADFGRLRHPHYLERPFYDHMAPLLERATLAIARSGASTLTELAVTGTPSLLIPYPFAAEDHQTYNARVFSEAGAAQLLPQSSLTASQLEQIVLALMPDSGALSRMSQAAQDLAVQDSAEQVAQLLRRP
jgi:UDP-N-acetylglucosamine--N-acetylmuramyl-(pentapeptide) pyrophosphoryl-undecaprenol N-acetylglucosamine transferase